MKRLYALGIDFGTSNSCVCQACYLRHDSGHLQPTPLKRPEPVPIHYRDTVPTAIFLGNSDDPPVYGEVAEEKSVFYPELTRVNFKMNLGKPDQDGAAAYEHVRDFLQFLRRQMEGFIPFDAPSNEAEFATCIGHPVQWSADQRSLTKKAAAQAGFPDASIEDETSAAIYGHLCEEQLKLPPGQRARILVIDMGGGTTDFAFVELPAAADAAPVTTPVDPSLLVPPWDNVHHSYGGRDMDELLLRHISKPWGYHEGHRQWSFLLRETRRFKEQFSLAMSEGRPAYQANWWIERTAQEIRLTRKEFEQIARSYIDHLPRLLETALSLDELRPDQVDAVILTGGSSRWYWVEDAVRSVLPHVSLEKGTLVRHQDPDQSVARGLAYKWMIEAGGGRPRPRRRATHGIWVASPELESPLPALPAGALADILPGSPASPLLVMRRGQMLPYRTPDPARLTVEKIDFNARQATLRLRLYSGSSESVKHELVEQVASFDRPLWESLVKRVSRYMPWSTSFDRDRFDVEVLCAVDENELFTGKVAVTRYYRGRPSEQQVQVLRVASQDPE